MIQSQVPAAHYRNVVSMKAAALAVVLLLVSAACAEDPVDAFIAQAEASAAAGEFGCLHDGTGNFECDEGVLRLC